MVTPDGKEIWFGRIIPAGVFVVLQTDSGWSEPRPAPFTVEDSDVYPVLAPDGNRLFFTSRRPRETGGSPLPRGRGFIWEVERTTGGWSAPRCLDSKINSARLQSAGSISNRGTLYFSAKTEHHSHDIFQVDLSDGVDHEPVNVTALSSPEPDHSPFVASDESYLIFSSFRSGLGRSDLFISFRNEDGSWSEPLNLGDRINSPYKDEYPYVTPDGQYFFFNSNRPSALNAGPIPDGSGNIYWMSAAFIEELRPDSLK
jgi:Tol biopolymer transport system component